MLALLCFCVATEFSANKDFINVHSRSNYREFLIALVGDSIKPLIFHLKQSFSRQKD